MAENINKTTESKLTEAQQKQLQDQLRTEVKEQVDRLGEVFAQCWESDEFKQAFIEDPKAIFREYGVNYAEDKEYVIIDSPEKTMVKVLPYDGIKAALRDHTETWMKKVEDLDDNEGMQIILDGWKEVVYQNTPNKFYISIPHCPDSLTPEELEMVNGGCIFAVFFFVAQTVFAATTLAVGAEVAVWLAVAVAEAAAALTTGVAVLEGYVVVAVSTIGFAITQTWLHSSASASASGTAAGISSTNTPVGGNLGASATNRSSRTTIR